MKSELMRSIVIQELSGGRWVTLLTMPIINPEMMTPEKIQAGIEEIHNMLYEGDKIHLSSNYRHVCIRGAGNGNKTFAVFASPEEAT